MSTALSCSPTSIFSAADIGKWIEIPKAGGTTLVPSTLLAQITAISGTSTMGLVQNATLSAMSVNAVSNVSVTWGTDNAPAFQAAFNACPPPFSTAAIKPLSPFTSKGCVIAIPNPGSPGTGDYMFGSGVSLPSQVSFQLIGMGNSSMGQESPLSGVRLVTAMPITILTVGNLTSAANTTYGQQNYGGFTIQAISFVDTSAQGAAIGGLQMNGVSEALIERCSFENFNGQQPGLSSDTLLSYGIKATAYGAAKLFNNNVVLFHPKGYNNSIFYDASQGGQDGPIVIGGDIFAINMQNTKTSNPPWGNSTWGGSTCIGIASSGGVRIYGTHFDVEQDTGGHACVGVLDFSAGLINAKFESTGSSPATPGTGVVLAGGAQTTSVPLFSGDSTRTTAGLVTVSESNSFTAGQVVTISHNSSPDTPNFDGNFLVTSNCASPPCTTFTYEYPGNSSGSTQTSSSGGSANPKLSFSANVHGFFNGLKTEVTIDQNAFNNTILDMSSGLVAGGSHVSDGGLNSVYQVSNQSSSGNTQSSMFRSGSTGGTDSMTITDTLSSAGSGHLLTVNTASGSSVQPVLFANNGNGVQMSTVGVLGPAGTGHITANNMLTFFCIGQFLINTTSYLLPGSTNSNCNASTNGFELPTAVTGTLANLFVKVGTASANAGDGVVTVYKDSNPTSLTCTLGTSTTCSDPTHTVSVTAGTDSFSVRITTALTGTESLANARVTLQIQ